MGTFSPYFHASPTTFRSMNDAYTGMGTGTRANVKQANEEASKPLYRNTTPTVSVSPQQQQTQKKNTTISDIKKIIDLAKKGKDIYDKITTVPKAEAVAANTVAKSTVSVQASEVATPIATSEAAGLGAGTAATEATLVEPIVATGAEAGLAASGEALTSEVGAATAGEVATAVAGGEAAATTSAAEGGTAAGSAASGMSATGIGSIIGAAIMAELYAASGNDWRNVDPATGEVYTKSEALAAGKTEDVVNTGHAFEGHFLTDPGMVNLLGNKESATAGEIFDAYATKGDWSGALATAPEAAMYWADPVTGMAKMASDKYLGTNIGEIEHNITNEVGKLFGLL